MRLLLSTLLLLGLSSCGIHMKYSVHEFFRPIQTDDQIRDAAEVSGLDCGVSDLGIWIVATPPLDCPKLSDVDREAAFTAKRTGQNSADLFGTKVIFYNHAMFCGETYAVGCTPQRHVVIVKFNNGTQQPNGWTILRHEFLHVMLWEHGISDHPCFLFNKIDPENMACKEERKREFPLKPHFADSGFE